MTTYLQQIEITRLKALSGIIESEKITARICDELGIDPEVIENVLLEAQDAKNNGIDMCSELIKSDFFKQPADHPVLGPLIDQYYDNQRENR